MPVEINKEIIVKTGTKAVFSSVRIERIQGKSRAVLLYEILDDRGTVLQRKNKIYSDDEFNTFWDNFNSYCFLEEEIARLENPQYEVPEEIEDTIKNT